MSSGNLKTYIIMLSLTVGLVASSAVLSAFPAMILAIALLPCPVITTAIFAYTTTKFSPKYILFHGSLILVLNVLFLGNWFDAFMTSLPILLCGLIMGICYNLKLSTAKLLCSSTVVYIVSIVLNIKYIGPTASGKTIFEDTIALLGQTYKEALMSIPSTNLTSDMVDQIVSELTSTLLVLSPSFIVITCGFMALLCYYAFCRILYIRHEQTENIIAFSMWRAEKSVSIVYFVITAIHLFSPVDTWISNISLNMIMVMTIVFFIFGLSFIEYKLKNRIRFTILRRLILLGISYGSLVFTGIPFFALSIFGALDGLFDYRHRKK